MYLRPPKNLMAWVAKFKCKLARLAELFSRQNLNSYQDFYEYETIETQAPTFLSRRGVRLLEGCPFFRLAVSSSSNTLEYETTKINNEFVALNVR